MKFQNLISNIDKNYGLKPIDTTYLAEFKKIVSDYEYIEFIELTNGGLFYDFSLHLYSFCNTLNEFDIFHVNNFIHKEYNFITDGLFSFGQDIFGNQFCFSKNGIIFFNIETGDKDIIASNFTDWCIILADDLDFYTGRKFSSFLKSPNYVKIERICPKVPFIIGGEYEINNFYLLQYPKYISVNANIARQIYNLPDGTEINLVISE